MTATAGLVVLIPAHNEAENLPFVIDELRACSPDVEILVVDDGSTDRTRSVLEPMQINYLRLHQQIGVGGAVRAGLRYAAMLGFDTVVRLDGDGQHRPEHLPLLLHPIASGSADAVLGSRYLGPAARRSTMKSLRMAAQWVLAHCLSMLAGSALTDPTSGFWAFGPRAVALLSEHHPTGYPEPELLLLLHRNGLRVLEVPIDARPRRAGRSTLTMSRSGLAAIRVLFAMLVVPLREVVKLPR
jgi:glycosyltransferase involved in cell wall biosynthesis